MGIQTTATEMFLKLDEEKRERVLSAAINEFADKNYNNASMNVVVKTAGISKGALFKYFRSKAGLFGFVYKMALGCVKTISGRCGMKVQQRISSRVLRR